MPRNTKNHTQKTYTKPTPEKMDAVILCGGLGTRLREETEFLPKPMVTIGDRPILWHIMKRYSMFGVRRFILCLGYKGHVIRDYFLNYRFYNSDFSIGLASGDITFSGKGTRKKSSEVEDWEIVLAETGPHSQTGSRIARILPHLQSNNFFATYGDGVSDVNIHALLKHHLASGKAATLTSVYPPSRFGEIIKKNGAVDFFAEKPQVASGAINGGFFVFDAKAVKKYLPRNPEKHVHLSLEGDILPELAEDKQLAAYSHPGFWQCMDTQREMEQLNTIYKQGNAPWLTPPSPNK
ncbi:MAG: glucose-1-phosphate cytidylyltransferase [Rickettsiales bacterium]|nr:glucose-1-phosphate cytidylyltransferase [Rickettsiales bacterium]